MKNEIHRTKSGSLFELVGAMWAFWLEKHCDPNCDWHFFLLYLFVLWMTLKKPLAVPILFYSVLLTVHWLLASFLTAKNKMHPCEPSTPGHSLMPFTVLYVGTKCRGCAQSQSVKLKCSPNSVHLMACHKVPHVDQHVHVSSSHAPSHCTNSNAQRWQWALWSLMSSQAAFLLSLPPNPPTGRKFFQGCVSNWQLHMLLRFGGARWGLGALISV